jgi:PncC family amidohydrolase
MSEPREVKLGRALRQQNLTLVVAESCTGGLVGHKITEVPGSSEYFLGGIIAYSNEVKERFLGVKSATLETYGAVSEETALEMADGVRKAFHADIAVAVTGIAGPSSDLSQKSVGLTWIAASTEQGTRAESHLWQGNRRSNKLQSAEAALDFVLKVIGEQA